MIITSAPRHFFRKFSSQSAIAESRWFVGSSKISTSHGTKSAATSARRFLCPPESSPVFCVKSVMPRRVIMLFASLSRLHFCSCACASASVRSVLPLPTKFKTHCVSTLSSTVISGSNTGFCGRYLTTIWLAQVTWPSSGSSSPAMIFNRVDFPVPLIPITPTFSPSCR